MLEIDMNYAFDNYSKITFIVIVNIYINRII